MTLLMLVLANCSSAPGSASRPAAAGPAQCTNCPASQATTLPAVNVTAPSSRPAGRDVPAYTRAEVAAIIAGAELEKGAIAKQRDEALERAKLGDGYAARLQSELAEAVARARWLPWAVGAGAAALAAAITAAVVHVVDRSAPATAP